MSTDLEKLRKVFLDLQKIRDADNKGLTQEAMAEKLNKDKVPSFSGNPWSKYAVRRMLKKLDLQSPNTRDPRTKASIISSVPAQTEAGLVAGLSDSSPLRQWGFYESIRGIFDELTSGNYTEQGLADELNQRGITTFEKKTWDEKSVARALTALRSSSNASSALLALDALPSGELLSDDAIRRKIKAGDYDTEKERFVAVAIKGGKDGKISKKSDKKKKGKKKK